MFEIKKATRKATPALIALWGPSGSGKTYSALELARGLVGPNGKIGIIDTENGRAEFYSERVGGWYHLDLQPPFAADKYVLALEKFQNEGGFDCVIIDSMSHVWSGIGGVLDQAEQSNYRGIKKWQKPKSDFNRMVDNLLRSPTDVIFCLRAKNASVQRADGNIERIGMTPICESNFIYEMTVSILLGQDHKPHFKDTDKFFNNPEYPGIKAPQEIFEKINPHEFLSEKTGEMIKKWISGGSEYDSELLKLQKVAREMAGSGLDNFKRYWESISKADRKALELIKEELKFDAALADKKAAEQEEQPEANTETTSSLDDDGPTPAEMPAEEPKEPEKEAEAPAATKTEKPADSATKEPETTEPEKEPAHAADEKPAEQSEAGNAEAPKLVVKSPMGDEYKFDTIEEWSAKALAMIEKAGTDKKALEGFNKRHATTLAEMEAAHPEQVQAVREAVSKALKPSDSEVKS